MPMKPSDSEFDRLRIWRNRPEPALLALWSEEMRELMAYLIERLGSDEEKSAELNQSSFPDLVKVLNAHYERGSRALGNAIVDGTAVIESGKLAEAEKIFRQFISACPSTCYQEVAEHYLEKIRAARI